MSSPACFWMAATTSGWQWPVDVTAMPAEKSKNSLPSTSVTTMPRPLLATIGYERVYDGEIYFSSPASTRLAFGPGRAVLILGPIVAVMVLVVMGSSSVCIGHWLAASCQLKRTSGATLVEDASAEAIPAEDEVNRYRREKDADARADWPDSGADT